MTRHRSHNTGVMLTVSCGDDELEVMAEIDFTITPGSPATGPSYSSGGEPAEPAEIEIDRVWLCFPIAGEMGHFSHEPAPQWLVDFVTNSDAVYQKLGDSCGWGEEGGDDPDYEYERQRDRID